MDIIQECDFCAKQAYVDGRTKFGPWAYMCPDHLNEYGLPRSLLNKKLVEEYPSENFPKFREIKS